MPEVISNATLNGVGAFTILGQSFAWNAGWIDTVNVGWPDISPTALANLTLTGSSWRIENMRLSGLAMNVTITDANAGAGRIIQTLTLADGSSNVTLLNTQVRDIRANDNGDATITLGAQNTRSIHLFDGDTTITGGAGDIEIVRTGSGNNSFIGGTGYLGFLRFGNGNDVVTLQAGADSISVDSGNSTVTTGAGFVGAITAYSNTADVNNFTIGTGGVRSLGVGNGRDTVTVLNGASFEQMQLGANDDRLTMQANSNGGSVQLGSGNNRLYMSLNSNLVSVTAFEGNDIFSVGAGQIDALLMGRGTNTLSLGSGFIGSVQAYEGNDTVTINGGNIEQINLGDGSNRVTLAAGSQINSLIGGGGNDTIVLNGDARILTIKVDRGNNSLTTNTGNVESYYSFEGSNTLNIGSGGIQQIVLSGDGGTHVVNSTGFLGSLQVYGNAVRTTVATGAEGAVSLFTGSGTDTIATGAGIVGLLASGLGNDVVTIGSGGVQFTSLGDGDDVLRLGQLNAASDMAVDGGAGIDRADFAGNTVGVTINLGAGVQAPGAGLGRLVLNFFENISGTAFADTITGDALANVLVGGNGNDALSGEDGNDSLTGSSGNDLIIGGSGSDRVMYTGTVAVVVNLSVTAAQNTGQGIDTLSQIEQVQSGDGNDSLTGNASNNILVAGAGNDTLSAGTGTDFLYGGLGSDRLTGGAGVDSFVFNTALGATNIDRITDFSVLEDTIRLDDTVFLGLATGALAASTFAVNTTGLATDALDRIIYQSTTGALYFDRDGTGAASRVQFASITPDLALMSTDFYVS